MFLRSLIKGEYYVDDILGMDNTRVYHSKEVSWNVNSMGTLETTAILLLGLRAPHSLPHGQALHRRRHYLLTRVLPQATPR